MPTIVDILTFMSRKNCIFGILTFMSWKNSILGLSEPECFTVSGPELQSAPRRRSASESWWGSWDCNGTTEKWKSARVDNIPEELVKAIHIFLLPFCAWFLKMFTGARKKKQQREMDWQLVASYFTVKSTDIFCSVHSLKRAICSAAETINFITRWITDMLKIILKGL